VLFGDASIKAMAVPAVARHLVCVMNVIGGLEAMEVTLTTNMMLPSRSFTEFAAQDDHGCHLRTEVLSALDWPVQKGFWQFRRHFAQGRRHESTIVDVDLRIVIDCSFNS
jgi:hypothetical protein